MARGVCRSANAKMEAPVTP
ncbi:hypothetical protein E2C01_091417 [Portunus trituberculatus]|uniref:Uncharacterized protein n=1 Tax=Portunus trituberculatus TaxID=210409 RepID=A0A5B7JNI6_PORTR|nr:hypothetical protein [Portunus trituberculatus]